MVKVIVLLANPRQWLLGSSPCDAIKLELTIFWTFLIILFAQIVEFKIVPAVPIYKDNSVADGFESPVVDELIVGSIFVVCHFPATTLVQLNYILQPPGHLGLVVLYWLSKVLTKLAR